jgi:hypothetical protein
MNSFLENRPVAASKNGVVATPKSEPGFHTLFPQKTPTKPESDAKPAPQAAPEAAPSVELVQNGGKVERIIVTCTCCKRIELQCQY